MIRPPPRSTLFPSPTLFRSYVSVGYGIATLGSVNRYRGLLVLAEERWTDAVGLLESALEDNASIGHEPYVAHTDRKSTRLNSSHLVISYAVFCLKKNKELVLKLSNPTIATIIGSATLPIPSQVQEYLPTDTYMVGLKGTMSVDRPNLLDDLDAGM